jgi:dolichyl-diphosphooligosaccharide--protein glycosyltransferase
MSWWDYGYQLNGIAERISIADGNTWNHEHIALLGKCLISNETASWEITRHLADYVLIWTTRYAGAGCSLHSFAVAELTLLLQE